MSALIMETIPTILKPKLIALFFFCIYFNLAHAAWSSMFEISFKTPGGHTICSCDALNPSDSDPSIIGFEKNIPRIKKFYFYKNHIVGYTDNLFFIFNEGNENLEIFRDKSAWKEKIKAHHLNPFITRWLEVSDAPSEYALMLVMGFHISIPLIFLVVYYLFQSFLLAIKKERFNLRKGRNTQLFIGIIILIIGFFIKIFWIVSI